ncbi:hypothetical protein JCM3770_001507 [Rhodotorula araucariae]
MARTDICPPVEPGAPYSIPIRRSVRVAEAQASKSRPSTSSSRPRTAAQADFKAPKNRDKAESQTRKRQSRAPSPAVRAESPATNLTHSPDFVDSEVGHPSIETVNSTLDEETHDATTSSSRALVLHKKREHVDKRLAAKVATQTTKKGPSPKRKSRSSNKPKRQQSPWIRTGVYERSDHGQWVFQDPNASSDEDAMPARALMPAHIEDVVEPPHKGKGKGKGKARATTPPPVAVESAVGPAVKTVRRAIRSVPYDRSQRASTSARRADSPDEDCSDDDAPAPVRARRASTRTPVKRSQPASSSPSARRADAQVDVEAPAPAKSKKSKRTARRDDSSNHTHGHDDSVAASSSRAVTKRQPASAPRRAATGPRSSQDGWRVVDNAHGETFAMGPGQLPTPRTAGERELQDWFCSLAGSSMLDFALGNPLALRSYRD